MLDVTPALGVNPNRAEDFVIQVLSAVRFVNVVLSGTNGEVDFQNIGFTAAVPEPGSFSIAFLLAAGWVAGDRRRRSRS